MGVHCTVCLPHSADSVHFFGEVLYTSITFRELLKQVARSPKDFVKQRAVFHAWTPREIVRRICSTVASRLQCPYFVHLEDNEEIIFESHTGRSVEQAAQFSWLRKKLLPRSFIHPDYYQSFLDGANGVTCIMASLKTLVPSHVPALTIWPACEDMFFSMPLTPDCTVQSELGIAPGTTTLTYTGNVHQANVAEVSTLYKAVKELNGLGYSVVLIRCGNNHSQLSQQAQAAAPFIRNLGNVAPPLLHKYIAAADILVQPGHDNKFNRFRFPSKLPMYLASGRPVLLPNSNIGKQMCNGKNCILLQSGSTEELVSHLKSLIVEPARAEQIGMSGRKFAKENFSWQKSAKKMLAFYKKNTMRVKTHMGNK